MPQPNGPGPGRSTAEAAVKALEKQIAERNAEAHKAARAKRTARDKVTIANRRKWDQL